MTAYFPGIIRKLYFVSCLSFKKFDNINNFVKSEYRLPFSATNNLNGLFLGNDLIKKRKDLTVTNKAQDLMIAPIEQIKGLE